MTNEDLLKIRTETKICPFCGEKPYFDYGYCPTYMALYCVNEKCNVRPSLEISVNSITNSDGKTYTPLFSEHVSELIEKWNVRFLA